MGNGERGMGNGAHVCKGVKVQLARRATWARAESLGGAMCRDGDSGIFREQLDTFVQYQGARPIPRGKS
jgi:hypothetical protein